MIINILKVNKNGHHFTGDIFFDKKSIFLIENIRILIQILLQHIPRFHVTAIFIGYDNGLDAKKKR